MQLLQRSHIDLASLERGNSLGGGAGGGERRDCRNAGGYGGAADGFLVEEWIGAFGSIHDQLNAVPFDQVNHVGAAFFHFVHTVAGHAGGFNHIGGASGGDEPESHVNEFARDLRDLRLVVVGDADEDAALRGQILSGGDLGFGEGFSEVIGDTHDFARGFHLR